EYCAPQFTRVSPRRLISYIIRTGDNPTPVLLSVNLAMKQLLLAAIIAGLALYGFTSPVIAQEGPKANSPKTDPDALRRAAMNSGGNASRGKAIFSSPARMCAKCHKVHGQGGDVGPDLSQIGGKFDRTHLIESILDPSSEIVQGFQATIIETKSGRNILGIVKSESETAVTIMDSEGKKIEIASRDIEVRELSKTSLMPVGLADGMTSAEFTDLIAYLESLNAGRRPTPGEGSSGALVLPKGFKAEVVATGLTGATAMEVASDGRVFV